jgi:AcrR family transcriptional regulator
MRRKLTPRGQERREQLMTTAARLFAERGYHPTSVADIVATLGVGKGVFYWYFASKEELLAELLRASNRSLRQRQQAAIEGVEDPVVRIELGIRATLVWFAEHREYFAIIQFAATDETFAPVLARNREISIADTIRHLKDGIVDGRIADRDPELLAHAIHGVVAELTRHALVEGNLSPESVSDLCVAFCLEGLQP